MRPAPTPRGPQLDPDTETFIILGVVGVGALLYTTAAAATIIGAFATGGGWVEAGWLDHGRALVSLPWHPGDPAAGYPPAAAVDLSGPVVWWSVAGVVLAVLVGVATWAVVRIRERRRRGGWAKRRDLRALRSGSEGVLLGLHHGRPVAVEERHSTLVIGATQTHKTTGLAVPAILEADDLAVIALSVKDDIVSDTIGWRSTLPGHHWLFDPTDALSPRGGRDGARIDVDAARRLALRPRLIRSGWSPLAMTATWQGALATAFDLARSGAVGRRRRRRREQVLLRLRRGDARLLPVRRRQPDRRDDANGRALGGATRPRRGGRASWPGSTARKPSATSRGSGPTTARRCRTSSPPPGSSSVRGSTRPSLPPASTATSIRPRSSTVTRTRCTSSPRPATRTGCESCSTWSSSSSSTTPTHRCSPADGRSTAGCSIIIDELANIAPIPNLGAIASTAASQGLQLVSIVQDLSQLRSRYGADDAGTIVNNHRALLLLSGVKDVATLELASKLLGTRRTSRTRRPAATAGDDAPAPRAPEMWPLAPIEDLRQQRRGTGTLIYGNLRGAELTLRPWFEHRAPSPTAPATCRPATGPLNPLPLDREEAAGGMTTAYDAWIERDPARRAAEVDFGTTWTTDRRPGETWRLSWNTGSGELVAVTRGGDDVEVLGRFDSAEEVEPSPARLGPSAPCAPAASTGCAGTTSRNMSGD